LYRTRLLALPTAALIALSLAACGGSDNGGGGDNNEDPQTVLERTFNNDTAIKSGKFDVSIKLDAQGDQGGSVETSLGGPFQSTEGEIPAFDIEGSVKANTAIQDLDFSGALISTGQAAFVSYKDTDYQVPQEAFDTFAQRFLALQQQSSQQTKGNAGNFLKSLGIDPATWLTSLSNDGTEDVEGSDTIHISGDADVPKLVADLKTLAEKSSQAAQVDPAQLDQLSNTVKEAHFDIFSGTDDNLLHKIEASLDIEPPAGTPGASGPVKVDFSLTLSDINQAQTVSAPEGAEPLDNLLKQFGVDPSAISGALGGSGLPQAGGSPAAPSGGSTDAYLQCLQNANSAAATQACAALL
jgi:hypothetical protein